VVAGVALVVQGAASVGLGDASGGNDGFSWIALFSLVFARDVAGGVSRGDSGWVAAGAVFRTSVVLVGGVYGCACAAAQNSQNESADARAIWCANRLPRLVILYPPIPQFGRVLALTAHPFMFQSRIACTHSTTRLHRALASRTWLRLKVWTRVAKQCTVRIERTRNDMDIRLGHIAIRQYRFQARHIGPSGRARALSIAVATTSLTP
jgi:hypothetical protein